MPNREIKMVARNLKAIIGREDIHTGVIGKHSLHLRTNNNGQKVTDLAISKSMIIASTCFSTRTSIKKTWTSPGGNISNQTDNALIETGRFKLQGRKL
jgi:hypothetical protein